MKRLTIFGVLALLAVGRANFIKGDFLPACGRMHALTEEAYNAIDFFTEEWPDSLQCYTTCAFEHYGYMKNGRFTQTVLGKAAAVLANATAEVAPAASIVKFCLENVRYYNTCVGVYYFVGCTIARAGLSISAESYDYVYDHIFQ